ncbi:MAG TPA: hypothetical protein VFB54_07255 [Burkholderiales bacterium]|nr:hypothetical protein [Burkholderiales bacterium]
MTGIPQIIQRSQLAGANLVYEIDVGECAVGAWVANASVAADALMRPTSGKETGFLYKASADGQTGALEPAWSTSGSVKDGSVTWIPVTPPVAGEDAIASVAWTQQDPPDSALTITGQTNDALTASAYLGAGTKGSVYVINVALTMASGAIYVVQIILTIL